MGIMIQQNDRTKLQERISSDLRRRASENSQVETDFTENTAYTKGMKKTSRFAWVWIVLVVLAIVSLFIIFI